MLAEPVGSPLPCRKMVLSLCPHLCPKERLWILIFRTGSLRDYKPSPANADASLLWLLEMFYENLFPQPALPLHSLLSLLGMKVRESCSFCNSIFRGSSDILFRTLRAPSPQVVHKHIYRQNPDIHKIKPITIKQKH